MPPKVAKNTQETAEKNKQPNLTDYGLQNDTTQKPNASDIIASGIVTGKAGGEVRSQSSKGDEILAILTAIKCDLDNIRQDIKNCSGRVSQGEARISTNEDDVVTLHAKVNSLETKQKSLENQVLDLQSRSRRNTFNGGG